MKILYKMNQLKQNRMSNILNKKKESILENKNNEITQTFQSRKNITKTIKNKTKSGTNKINNNNK